MSAPAPKRRPPGQLTLFHALKRTSEPDEDVPPPGFNTETPAKDLNAVTERSNLSSLCRPATSPPSASPAAKKRSVESGVISKTSFHFVVESVVAGKCCSAAETELVLLNRKPSAETAMPF